MSEQLVRCTARPDGACAWVELDPDDGRPCVSLCAMDVGIRAGDDD